MSPPATLTGTVDGERLGLVATGAWTAAAAAELEKIVDDTAQRYQSARRVDIDLAKIDRLDTFGAWLIERLKRSFAARGSAAEVIGLSDGDRSLMDEVQIVNRTAQPYRPPPGGIASGIETIGRAVAGIGWSLVL